MLHEKTLRNALRKPGARTAAQKIQAVYRGMLGRREYGRRLHERYAPGGPGYQNALRNFQALAVKNAPRKNAPRQNAPQKRNTSWAWPAWLPKRSMLARILPRR